MSRTRRIASLVLSTGLALAPFAAVRADHGVPVDVREEANAVVAEVCTVAPPTTPRTCAQVRQAVTGTLRTVERTLCSVEVGGLTVVCVDFDEMFAAAHTLVDEAETLYEDVEHLVEDETCSTEVGGLTPVCVRFAEFWDGVFTLLEDVLD